MKEHARFMQKQTKNIPNVTYCDWSSTTDNPFVTNERRPNTELFTADQFHVNHMGFRHLWVAWSEIHSDLTLVPYQMSALPYQQTV